jgi:hypothetical protein
LKNIFWNFENVITFLKKNSYESNCWNDIMTTY